MKKCQRILVSFMTLILMLTFTISPAATGAAPLPESVVQKVDVFGYYFPQTKLPAAFAEIDHLHLSTIDSNARPAPLNGFIRPKRRAGKDYKLVRPRLVNKSLTFTTQAIGGISYSFTGAFSKLGNFPVDRPEGEAVLKGRLIKMRNGKKIAETAVSFTYTGGD